MHSALDAVFDDGGDHYTVLGIAPAADAGAIRRAFRLLALRHHPDRAGAQSTARFQRIALAYRVLSDPAARAAYDGQRREAAATAARAATAGGPAFIARLTAPLDTLLARAAARLDQAGTIELLLTEAEAREGGGVGITLPRHVPCPTCAGCAQPASIWCVRCEYAGTVREDITVCVTIPPAAADGLTFMVRMDFDESLPPLRVRVRL